MSVFGFIENFFFISLGIVFGLILLLVYHFKNRMAIAEKKSESMYGLLSAVVKEIKSLRGMFGLGGETAKAVPPVTPQSSGAFKEHTYEVQTKSDPEVIVPVTSDPVEREVITLELNASEPIMPPKIIVSDVESEYDSEPGSDLEESEDSNDSEDEEDEDEDEYQDECPLEELNVEDLDVDPPTNSEPLAHIEEVDLSEVQEVVNTNIDAPQPFEFTTRSPPSASIVPGIPEPPESTNDDLPIPSNDQLRKMNINQLKSIAILQGITVDTSKMKKPELIHLIQAK